MTRATKLLISEIAIPKAKNATIASTTIFAKLVIEFFSPADSLPLYFLTRSRGAIGCKAA